MTPENEKFIDALVDRNYVIMVQWQHIDMDSFIAITKHEQISPKDKFYTITELYTQFPTDLLRILVHPYLIDSEKQKVRTYVAHKNNLKTQYG
jgi:hypothetical protein